MLVCDLLHFARHVPLFPLERSCALGELAELRSSVSRESHGPFCF